MSTGVAYEGDQALQRRLEDLGVTRTFAEVRAMMARDAWSLEPATLEDTTLAIIAGSEEAPMDLTLVTQLRALRALMATHAAEGEALFQVFPAPPAKSGADLIRRLADRRAETGILMGIFVFNRHVYPQLCASIAPLAGSLERTICGLDKKRTLIATAPEVFDAEHERSAVEKALDEIDQAIGHGFTVAARAIAAEKLVRLGVKSEEKRAIAKRQTKVAQERSKAKRRAESDARKKNR